MKILYVLLFLIPWISVVGQQQFTSPAEVQKAIYFDVSPPLRDMVNLKNFNADGTWKDGVVKNNFNNRKHEGQTSPVTDFTDPNLQEYFGQQLTDTTIQNFEGLNGGSYIPPDTDGDIGPDHYFQVVNCSYAIYNKGGAKLLGPLSSSSVWSGMPNNSNDGDAVVLYDEVADRWLFSQFSLPNFPNGPFYQMIAVSQTPDPTGSWYRYQYQFSTMPDYPKFGIWPDGYYMSCNRFTAGSTNYTGTGAAAFDRTKMLAGDPEAEMVWFTLSAGNEAYSMLPSDCDGEFPATGTPNYFTYEYDASPFHLGILEFHVNWTTPGSSTFGSLVTLPVNSFNPNIGNGIPQKGTTVKLATLSDRLMFRLQFRKFSDHWSMVCNHSVNIGSAVAGIRWYELRKTTGAWTVYQQATYGPSDNNSRWMGSLAMDSAGNIAVGYSISSSTMYPSIRYTGRLSTDPINQMTINERGIINGGGCQTSSTRRWGDYSAMGVDPLCPTTFWYTQEYYETTSSGNWQTRIASFTFSDIFSSYATANPVKVCIGDSSQLNSIAYGGSGSYTYLWTSIPAGFTSDQKDPKVAPSDTTKYIVEVSDGIETHHDTTQVMIIPHPTVFAGNDTLVCSWVQSIDLHGIATSYKLIGWGTTGDGYFSDASSLNTTYYFGQDDYQADSVDLMLVAFALSPCSGKVTDTRHVTLDPCSGITETATTEDDFIVQPNPAKEFVKITLPGNNNESAFITLTTLSGQVIYSDKLTVTGKSFIKEINLDEYHPGIYFITVRTDKKVITKRLVVY